MEHILSAPPLYAIKGKVSGNPVEQVRIRAGTHSLTDSVVKWNGGEGRLAKIVGIGDVLVSPKHTSMSTYDHVVVWPGLNDSEYDGASRWLRPRPTDPTELSDGVVAAVRESWRGQFTLIPEREVDGVERSGLRPPQVGALHAALAHWTVTTDVGTIVMPTGTGKTETMVALLAREQLERLLVIAPTNALRLQIAEKFATLGLLKQIGETDSGELHRIVGEDAQHPIVGRLEHSIDTVEKAVQFAQSCNVVIATVSALTHCSDEVQEALAGEFSHLFIDEAHHAPARTWDWFRYHFVAEEKPVLQFTATPYRRDGKHIGGSIIFDYPLRKAQNEGYFRRIEFQPLWEYNSAKADEGIARLAVDQLQEDEEAGHDHIVMARTDSKEHAEQLAMLYEDVAPQYNPVCIHSDVRAAQQRERLSALFERRSRIVCCVNMLGEGFDLPQLKIAALHTVHKSLAITIQFTGRFTRKGDDVGDATVIANLADAKVEDAIEDLYAEDPDWNEILVEKSSGQTEKQRERTNFVKSFGPPPLQLPIQNFQPKMSAVVYRTHCDRWTPTEISSLFPEENLVLPPKVSKEHSAAVFVIKQETPADWANTREVRNVTHDLYLLHWNEGQRTFYINSTNNNSIHRSLAEAVAGEDVEHIHGEDVYRALADINRAILSNVGLRHSFSRAVQFSMHVGTDIARALSDAQAQNRTKTNLFARGFENGKPATVGCSHRKGRVWSYQVADSLSEWVEWATGVGAKLINNSIEVEELIKKVIKPIQIKERPDGRVPLTIEWSEYFWMRDENSVVVSTGGNEVPFFDAEMRITEFSENGPLRFAVETSEDQVDYEIRLSETGASYVPLGDSEARLRVGTRAWPLSRWFQEEHPVVRFDNNAFLVGDLWYEPTDDDREPFDPARIIIWNWDEVDIRTESKRKTNKEARTVTVFENSIQAHVIAVLQSEDWEHDYDVIIDDDGTREAADVVAVRIAAGDRLVVHLFHLKYSAKDNPGARVGDLYEVCGQAQRSIVWRHPMQKLFEHLQYRESQRQTDYNGESRFEKGEAADLGRIAKKARFLNVDFEIFIVQPGLSVKNVTERQLNLLAATETYLKETYEVPLHVIAHAGRAE